MSHPVFLIAEPGLPRNHQAIFISTSPDGSGTLFQVTGNIQDGMVFGHRESKAPEESPTFISKEHIGTILKTDFDRVQTVVEEVEPPKKQFDKGKRLYPREPLRRCQEWTAEAVQALRDAAILK
ncbi:hypothetical protein CC80DRAFT_593303 [Byssothecium circinans]|uniref:Uncharacterized protein n=1 Tax=Byssothecium circinans TaxID=147558 RepID=A0A6A5TWW9_9PLEO|nr:hypothetical protein CC80DRAFT_593303 [Byssothecium circinans]